MKSPADLSLLEVSFRSQASPQQRQVLTPAKQHFFKKVGVSMQPRVVLGSNSKKPPVHVPSAPNKTKKVLVVEEFDPKDYVVPGVTEKEVQNYKEIFDLFSISKTGLLTPLDLRNAMESFGFHPKKSVVYQIVSEIDDDESGGIDFREFLNIVTGQTQNTMRNDSGMLSEVFKHYDQTSKGFCTKKEFAAAAKDLGEDVSSEKINQIFALLSPDDPEKLSFESFSTFVKNWEASKGSSKKSKAFK